MLLSKFSINSGLMQIGMLCLAENAIPLAVAGKSVSQTSYRVF